MLLYARTKQVSTETLNYLNTELKPQKSSNRTRIATIFTGNDSEEQIRRLKICQSLQGYTKYLSLRNSLKNFSK